MKRAHAICVVVYYDMVYDIGYDYYDIRHDIVYDIVYNTYGIHCYYTGRIGMPFLRKVLTKDIHLVLDL